METIKPNKSKYLTRRLMIETYLYRASGLLIILAIVVDIIPEIQLINITQNRRQLSYDLFSLGMYLFFSTFIISETITWVNRSRKRI